MNPVRQTLKEAGYKYIGCLGFGEHVLEDKDGRREIWFNSKNHSGYGLKWNNTHLEFARSIT